MATSADLGAQGGLDCRYLATNLHAHTFRVLSVTTISSPHRGSSFAEAFLHTVGPERFPSFLSLLDMLPIGGGDGSAFSCLTPAAMREFNEQTPDIPDIKYFSWGAVYSPGLIDTWRRVFSLHSPTFYPSVHISYVADGHTRWFTRERVQMTASSRSSRQNG